ncbi:MAG: class I SAM-dependent methyltransferase [Beijerinckiaceae bacterium]
MTPVTQPENETLDARLTEHRRIWDQKPTLRAIYQDFHTKLEAACPPGPLLDIGGGSAHFKNYRPDVTSLDILPFPGIDVVADAHQMPFEANTFSGIVMLDVLHHLQRPVQFIREAARVLQPGGRLAMIEPGMSAVSKIFYDKFHQEPVVMSADPFAENTVQSGDDPFDSNQAIPTLLFGNKTARTKVEMIVPDMKVTDVRWLSLVAYPLSGGFKSWCLWPAALVRPAIAVENVLMPLLGPINGFRLMIILERR